MAGNEVDPYRLTLRILGAVGAGSLALAPCTLGLSLVMVVFAGLGAGIGYALLEWNVSAVVDRSLARAWSGATVMGRSTRVGVLWLEDDTLWFASGGSRTCWVPAQRTGLRVDRRALLGPEVVFGQGEDAIRLSVADPEGWMRALGA